MELLEDKLQRIILTEMEGEYIFGRLRIHYNLSVRNNKAVSERELAVNFITTAPVEGKDIDVIVLMHDAVPGIFREIVLLHEIIEAYFRFVKKMDTKSAHKAAVPYEEEYAKQYFSKVRQRKYFYWREQVRHGIAND